eukprot:114026-Prymnesium_polylepis.1
MGERESRMRTQWYARVFDDVVRGLHAGDSNSAHGALLALTQLLDVCDGLDEQLLAKVFECVWLLRETRIRLVRNAVLAVLPRLARRATPALFAEWVPDSTRYLISALRSSADRGPVFIAMGQMAKAAGTSFEEHIPAVVRECHEALVLSPPKGFARPTMRASQPEALQCLAMLSEAHSAAVEPHIFSVLPSIFHCGLSPALTIALAMFVKQSPALLAEIQWRLLDLVSFVFTQRSYMEWLEQKCTQPAAFAKDKSESKVSFKHGTGVQGLDAGERDGRAEQLSFALRTLGSFDFNGCNLVRFAYECVSVYLEDASSQVRCSAATACCKILSYQVAGFGLPNRSACQYAARVCLPRENPHMWKDILVSRSLCVCKVLERVMLTAVGDENSSIRHAILLTLSSPFDIQLAK